MIPIRDDIPSRSFPFVNYALILVNVLVFLWELNLGDQVEGVFQIFGLVPARFHAARGLFVGSLPIFTSMFLHGGLLHLLGNMLYLHIFGDNIEDRMGHLRYFGFYLVCGAVAALAQVWSAPTSQLPMVGASGAIAGVTGAYFVNFPKARILTAVPIFFYIRMVYIPAILFLLFWFVIQLVSGAASIGADAADVGGVAWWAHIAGFLSGMVLGTILVRRRR